MIIILSYILEYIYNEWLHGTENHCDTTKEISTVPAKHEFAFLL